MPVTSTHPQYKEYVDNWIDCRIAFEGEKAVKAARTRYLPKLVGQSEADYESYKNRAVFYAIVDKTVQSLVGMAADMPVELHYPEPMSSYFNDHSGLQFNELMLICIQELVLMARVGVLVDRPATGGGPYFVIYKTEDIINWKMDRDRLTSLVLREQYEETSDTDEFDVTIKVRYRHLKIENDELVINVYDERPSLTASYTVINTGRVMSRIPFVCANSKGLNIEPARSSVQDLVSVNFSQYRSSADLEHGRHFTGLPTPYITGAAGDEKMRIGSTTAWVIPNEKATVGFLEFTGQGLQSLEKAIVEKKSLLASLSARLIDNSSRGSEAAETVRLRYMSETASLKVIVMTVQALLNEVYGLIAEMEGYDASEIRIKLNTDFLGSKMSAAELTAWTRAYLDGAVPMTLYIHALKEGRVMPTHESIEGDFVKPEVNDDETKV